MLDNITIKQVDGNSIIITVPGSIPSVMATLGVSSYVSVHECKLAEAYPGINVNSRDLFQYVNDYLYTSMKQDEINTIREISEVYLKLSNLIQNLTNENATDLHGLLTRFVNLHSIKMIENHAFSDFTKRKALLEQYTKFNSKNNNITMSNYIILIHHAMMLKCLLPIRSMLYDIKEFNKPFVDRLLMAAITSSHHNSQDTRIYICSMITNALSELLNKDSYDVTDLTIDILIDIELKVLPYLNMEADTEEDFFVNVFWDTLKNIINTTLKNIK